MYEFPSSEQIERYSFGDKIGKSPDLDSKPIICYDYIDLEQTKYHFHQSCFDQKDIKSYFKKLKDFSKKTINTLIDSDYREHFHLYWEPNSKIKK
ncbi:MAG: hypothetical protein KDD94_13970, partial [Calditrichaeota bacterium]|nr:hypothetical protein [Calditrichota bacterium]